MENYQSRSDAFFSKSQIERLQALMAKFQQSINADNTFNTAEKAELEKLIDAEWAAAIARGTTILAQTSQLEIEQAQSGDDNE